MVRILLIFISALYLSCDSIQQDVYSIYEFQVPHVDGLTIGAPVLMNEEQVGNVKNVKIDGLSLHVTVHLDKPTMIPVGSSFVVVEVNPVIIYKIVRIDLADAEDYISPSAILTGRIEKLKPVIISDVPPDSIVADSIIKAIKEGPDYEIYKALFGDKLDSVLENQYKKRAPTTE